MLPKAILFDIDDTILEEDKAADLAWEKVCQIFAAKTGLFKTADLFRRINYNRKHYWTDAKRAATQDRGRVDFFYSRLIIVKSSLDEIGLTDNNVLAEEIVRTFTALKLELTEFVPDAENILRELFKRKIKLALLTNGEGNEQRSKICNY